MKKHNKTLAKGLIMMFFLVFGAAAIAANFYQSSPNTEITVDEHSVCKKVKNTGEANTYFIPTKTAAEWSSFINNSPSDINMTDCVTTPTFSGSGSCAGKGLGDVQRIEGTSNQLKFYADDGGGASMLCATIDISGTSFSYSYNGGPYQSTGTIFRQSGVFISNLTDSTTFTFWAEPSSPGNYLKIQASGGVTFTFNGGHPPYDDYRYTEALSSNNNQLSFYNSFDGWAWTWAMN